VVALEEKCVRANPQERMMVFFVGTKIQSHNIWDLKTFSAAGKALNSSSEWHRREFHFRKNSPLLIKFPTLLLILYDYESLNEKEIICALFQIISGNHDGFSLGFVTQNIVSCVCWDFLKESQEFLQYNLSISNGIYSVQKMGNMEHRHTLGRRPISRITAMKKLYITMSHQDTWEASEKIISHQRLICYKPYMLYDVMHQHSI